MNLDSLRERSYSGPTARAWGHDMRPVGRDDVVVVVPGTPRFYAHRLAIADLDAGPAAGPLGIIPGAVLGWLAGSLMQQSVGLYATVGALLGWVLFALTLSIVGGALIRPRLGLPQGAPLVLVAHPSRELNADQGHLLMLMDEASDHFVRAQIDDRAFTSAIAQTIPALRPRTTPATVDAARAALVRLLDESR
ncbi:hypothetical protein GCM10028787_31510 [Brachybacterium horti]